MKSREISIHEGEIWTIGSLRIMTIDPKGTRISGFLAPGKRKGRLKGWKVEISKPRIPERDCDRHPKETQVVGSWTPGEMLLGARGV
jgi:hypothetical protein